MNSMPQSVIIIGAGVIGLSLGWRLSQAGIKVRIFDRGEPGKEASWTAAGMLAAAAETEEGHETFFALARASRDMWAGFAAEVEAASGHEIEYRSGETLVVARSLAEEEELRARVQYLRTLDEPTSIKKAPHELVPELADDVTLGHLSPRDGVVDNRALCEALVKCVRNAGGEVITNTSVDDIAIEGARCIGVVVGGKTVSADHVVLAAGPWSSTLPSVHGRIPETKPIKGQMIGFQGAPGQLKAIVWGEGVYIVPRKSGLIIVGATQVDAGFDKANDEAAVASQREKAIRVLPFLADLPMVKPWTGLRPGSPDDLPIMGPLDIQGLTLSSGHFRNGILLAPISAALVAETLVKGEIPAPLYPFLPTRFKFA